MRVRAVATLVVAAFAVGACGEETPLETTVDPVAMQADIDAAEAALETPEVVAFASLGFMMDAALGGGPAVIGSLTAELLADGPTRPSLRVRDRLLDVTGSGTAHTIPLPLMGKTFVWDVDTDEYVVSALTGAPAGGVRFIIYELDEFGYPVEPLNDVGYVDITETSTASTVSGSVRIYTSAAVKVMEYTVTVGGTENVPVITVDGFVGVGANQLTFDLALGVSLTTGNVTISWRTAVPSRGLSTRVQLAIGESAVTIGAVMRNGLRKVDIGGTLFYDTGGQLTVKVGNRVFAVIDLDEFGGGVIVDANGDPLSAEDEETLWRIFDWFESAFAVPDVLLAPVFTILELDSGGSA